MLANRITVGCDVGGAHLKLVRAEGGKVVEVRIMATPLWQGLDRLETAFAQSRDLFHGVDRVALTMTGELTDVFSSREEGVNGLLDIIAAGVPIDKPLIYAGNAGLVPIEQARGLPVQVASANWHATASLVAGHVGEALFVDMGSTTTDIIPVAGGKVANEGYSDAERLLSGELVYTGFTRTFLFGVASSAPVRGRISPLMNEYFASMADVHRVLGVLDEADDMHATADGKPKTAAASMARIARMVGLDAADLTERDWRDVANWFSEQQLRTVHDAALRCASRIGDSAPVVAAGIGSHQIGRLASRMGRRLVQLSEIIPSKADLAREAAKAAAATALALLPWPRVGEDA